MLRSKEEVKQALADAYHDVAFYVCDGKTLKNLKELAAELRRMSADAYQHHVTEHKNDFSNWIKDIFKDETLAKEITGLSKSAAAKKISARIKELKAKLKKTVTKKKKTTKKKTAKKKPSKKNTKKKSSTKKKVTKKKKKVVKKKAVKKKTKKKS